MKKQAIIGKHYLGVGTNNLWFARLWGQIMKIRDSVLSEDQIKKFDKPYGVLLENLENTYSLKNEIQEFIKTIKEKIKNKTFFDKQQGENTFISDGNIDRKLNQMFSNYVIHLNRAVDDQLVKLCNSIGYDYSFWTKDNSKKEQREIAKHPEIKDLVEMFKNERDSWFRYLNKVRNDYDHNGYKLPEIKYEPQENKIYFPDISEDVELLWENAWKFIEEVIVFTLSFFIKDPDEKIVYIPKEKRDKSNPIKYKIENTKIMKIIEEHIKNKTKTS